MNLKELQAMIKEELDSYMNEEEIDVDVDDADVDADGDMKGDDSEEILKKIFDMLKDKFEGEDDEDMGDDEADEDMMEGKDEADEDMKEVKDDDKMKEDADLDESDGYTGKAGKGGTGYDGKAGRGGTGYDAGSKALQERLQKLANIVKG